MSKGSEEALKVLLLDVEVSPNIATVWGIYDQNISINQLLESSYLLCYAAKWLGEKEIMWERAYGKQGKYRMGMLRKMNKLLSSADVVIHFNGKRFDMGVINKELFIHGFEQPAPYHQLDLYQIVKRFRFTSSKLDYICRQLKIGKKTPHQGHELWLACMEDDPKAWETMRKYNINDVHITEKLFVRLGSWIKTHPSKSMRTVADMILKEKL